MTLGINIDISLQTKDCVAMDYEVYDEVDVASILEEHDRNYAISKIISTVPASRDIDSLLNEGLECGLCGEEISLARQRIVLTISRICEYCVDCQNHVDKSNRLYA